MHDPSHARPQVVQYNLAAHERDPHALDWVDTSLKAEVNRVNVSFNPTFMSNVLEFVKQLEINKSSYTSAAKATAENCYCHCKLLREHMQ